MMQSKMGCLTVVIWIAVGTGMDTALADDLQVNTYTTGEQRRPSVALDAAGDFVVVWDSNGSVGPDTSGYGIQGQRYASDGSALGGQFQVNTYTTGEQRRAEVVLHSDGDFVVVWQSVGSGGTDSDSYSIQGQRYASDGSALGGQFQVNTYTTGRQSYASVSVDEAGDFVVVWDSSGSGGTDTSFLSVQAQRYTSDGSTVGGQFQVNTYTTSFQFLPTVSVEADGDFVIVWTSYGSGGTDTSGLSIQGQRYASDGAPAGSQFQVNTYTTGDQRLPLLALDADGDFVVVWYSDGSSGTDTSYLSIQGQRYASDGSTVGGELQVNTYTTSFQSRPAVALDSDGDFVVVWQSFTVDSSGFGIQGQRYSSDGSTVGGELQVNTHTLFNQSYSSVSIDDSGDFVVVWQSETSGGTDSDGSSIQKADAAPVPVELMSFSVESD